MAKPSGKAERADFNNTFRLPRKGSSAIQITAPKTNTRKSEDPPPNQKYARVPTSDARVSRKSSSTGATSSTGSLNSSSPKSKQLGLDRNGSKVNGETSQIAHESDSAEDPATTMQLQQVRKVRRGASPAADLANTQQKPVAVQRPNPQLEKNALVVEEFNNAQTSTLDVYATNYVPQYKRAINDSPAQIRYSMPLSSINYPQYIANFAGFGFLQPLEAFPCLSIELPPAQLDLARELSPHNYGISLTSRLHHEVRSQNLELQDSALYTIQFLKHGPLPGLYSFIIPGIREDNPRIDLGDVVLVRPWALQPHESLALLARDWYATRYTQPARPAPGFTGWEYRAVVWGIQRSQEQVVLRLDDFPPDAPWLCNISFILQDHKCSPLYAAIMRASRTLLQDKSLTKWLQGMLFPAESNGVLQSTLSKGTFDLPWYDKLLNFEQQKAVDAIVERQYGTVPFFISGPPGTGKTKTLVEAALQLLHSAATANERSHILICAPSDSAADTIATRLQAHLNPMEMFRLNGWTRSFAEVPGPLLIHSYIANDLFAIPQFSTMMNFKVVVTTCRDAEMLVQARLTNADLAVLTTQLSAITSRASAEPLRLHWSALLLDEAAQATEPDALIPLLVIQPGPEPTQGFHSLPQFVMAGDEHQLGPKLSSRSILGLQCTLFRRLFERDVYAEHPLSRKNGLKRLTANMLPLIRPPFVNLVRNYRSHPAILTVPSILFYHDTLIPDVRHISPAVASWLGWQGPLRWPVLFVQNTSPDSVESLLTGTGTGAGALLNAGEADVAEGIVKSLLGPREAAAPHPTIAPPIHPHEVTIIAPYRAQVHYLRKRFRAVGLAMVNIGPLEAFQGLESKVVILCTTRTRLDGRDPARFVKDDQAKGIGLIGDAQKFNVAVTRAKEALIVIGDSRCLTCTGDRSWAAFIAFCERNGCFKYAGKNQGQEGTGLVVQSDVPPGRMERAMKYAVEMRSREAEKMATRPIGFGYATKVSSAGGGRLRGPLQSSDEAMWAEGMRLAEENEMGEVDEEEEEVFDDTEEDEAQATSIAVPGPTTDLDALAQARKSTAIPALPIRKNNATDASVRLISLSSEGEEVESEQAKQKAVRKSTGIGVAGVHDAVFDRDIEMEARRDCEMQ